MERIKHELTKQVDKNTIVTVIYGIYDACNNGYNHFEFNYDLWGTNGDRHYGSHKEYKGKKYYFIEDLRTEEEIKIHFPELINVFKLNGKDSFGIDSYPILNGKYYLQTDIKHAAKYYGIALSEAKIISKFNETALTDYILKLIKDKYSPMVKAAVMEIEATTGQKFTNTDKVSPTLYNDIHYTFITEKEGWNVYKGNQTKIKTYPKYK